MILTCASTSTRLELRETRVFGGFERRPLKIDINATKNKYNFNEEDKDERNEHKYI
jgi:hypothetical protein